MTEFVSKVIKDPIHGFIDFNGKQENDLKLLLSDQFFQRLRRVKQLGFSDYVFPSAAHSRFSHSLGVYSIAKRMLTVVESNGINGEWSLKGQACLAAALLHDVGHGMFSHAFENAMKFFLKRNSLEPSRQVAFEEAVNHEKVSQKIITDSSIAKALRDLGGDNFPTMVCDMIKKTDKNCVYTSIVSSQLDADRLDYAQRDAYFAGVSSGGIDLDWLIRNFKKAKNGEAEFLYVGSKAYISLEQFTVTLFHLYPTIYLHKKTRGLEYMFALLLSRVFELIASGAEKQAGISSDHPFVRFFNEPHNLEHTLLLDDTVFWGSLHQLRTAPDASIKWIAGQLSARKIFQSIDVWKILDQAAVSRSAVQKLPAGHRVRKFDEICEQVCKEITGDGSPWADDCYHDTYDRPIYKPRDVEGGHPQQINVEVGGQIRDIASISPLVASAASFNIHRIHYDESKFSRVDNLTSEIRKLVAAKLDDLEV
ncbi:HD domain-containing protein [Rhizobium leguminosarum]|uniref:HD domain-containing protein n=1 Tax=Rhizobium leguminosarum TaxID=384 RepID=UPI001C93EC40|nr:HD domain-containing protein [Rhizobium leguminosarum]MBY5664928.1 HD domain-containing protein [Rhizobium leguminosarum]MBY5677588.1 HD domain-containing protein [Rhizobium leguminosarum]